MRQPYWIVVSLFLLPAGARAQQSIPTLDLTKPVSCELPSSGVIGDRAYATPPSPLPLDLRLVHIEPQPLRWGGKVIYEVELENVGATPFLIPWGTICDVPWGDDPNKVKAGVLLILDEYPNRTWLAHDFAYGMLNAPRTMRSVGPREKVRIRIKGHAFTCCSGEDPVAKKLEHKVYLRPAPNSPAAEALRRLPPKVIDVDVRAEFGFLDGPYRGHLNRKSLNMVPLKLTKRPAP